MKSGIIDSKGIFREVPFYEIQGLCEKIVSVIINKSEKYRRVYEEYKKNMHRFSPAFDFCIRELGWMLYDPFQLDRDEVLFSNGHRFYVASIPYVKKENFNRKEIQDETIGFSPLTDEAIHYNRELVTIEGMNTGIIDERGYVSSENLPSMDILAQIEIMYDCIASKEAYEDYQNHGHEFITALEYRTSKRNIIGIKKHDNGKFTLEFVSENDGKVQTLIEALQATDSIDSLIPMVTDERREIMKVA